MRKEEGMNILSLDTSTDVLSIALRTQKSYEERLISGNFSHSENLLSEILSFLQRAKLTLKDLDLLVAAKGPGSFTGLRVGIASLKGIRAASNAKLVSVPTLSAMAYPLRGLSAYPVLAVIDAAEHTGRNFAPIERSLIVSDLCHAHTHRLEIFEGTRVVESLKF